MAVRSIQTRCTIHHSCLYWWSYILTSVCRVFMLLKFRYPHTEKKMKNGNHNSQKTPRPSSLHLLKTFFKLVRLSNCSFHCSLGNTVVPQQHSTMATNKDVARESHYTYCAKHICTCVPSYQSLVFQMAHPVTGVCSYSCYMAW